MSKSDQKAAGSTEQPTPEQIREAEEAAVAAENARIAEAEKAEREQREKEEEEHAERNRLAAEAAAALKPATVKMYRDEPTHPSGPTTADVHPDEVENMLAFGWLKA